MQLTESPRAEGIRRLYELMLRVNSSTDLSEVLDEIARGVVEVLGLRHRGDRAARGRDLRDDDGGRARGGPRADHRASYAGGLDLQRVRPGRRVGRAPLRPARPDARRARGVRLGAGLRARHRPRLLAPARRALRAAVLRHRASCSATCRSTCRPATGSRTARSASCSRCSWCRPAWRCTTPSSASASATRSGWARCCASVSLGRPARRARRVAARGGPGHRQGPAAPSTCGSAASRPATSARSSSPRRTRPTTGSPSRELVQVKSLLASRAQEAGPPGRDQPRRRLRARAGAQRAPSASWSGSWSATTRAAA